ncbi:MAG TPA: MFS transporter [Chloroflexota bacterium]|nr:MFS transporter [Chloroflexota bacterium]
MRRELPAASLAALSVVVLLMLIYVGSRGLRDFDSALIGYAVGTVFATAAIVYRYTSWITRPPTWRYFRAGWTQFLSWSNFRRYSLLVPRAWWTDIFAQTFILERGLQRWVMHMAIFWGVILSLAVTIPLSFGWIRFTLVPPTNYMMWFFGLPVFEFPIEAGTGFALFHVLDWTALLLIVGVGIALYRRVTDVGLLSIQRLGFDLTPLVLLFAIAITGLALTASSLWWEGRFYWFISLVHQATVVGWLLSLPFGKFFHIVQRPASIGVTLYQTVNQPVQRGGAEHETSVCRACGTPLPSRQFLTDLTGTLSDLNQRYDLGADRGLLQEYCPTCKRRLRGQAYFQVMGKRFL